jgi:hypothetical protein
VLGPVFGEHASFTQSGVRQRNQTRWWRINFSRTEIAQKRGIFTIGIDDGGNEIDCGNIVHEAREIKATDWAVTVVVTDVLVFAAVSWT